MSDLPLDTILAGDCVEVLASLPAASVDLIFADPPYNLQLRGDLWRPDMTRVHGVTDGWDRFDGLADYDRFTRAWLVACRRVLKDDGTLWVIGSYHNIYRIGAALMDLGYWILNDIIWTKTNPMPNFRGVRFTNAHETLIWAAKSSRSRYTFNYHTMKQLNGGKQMRSDWRLPICSGAERIRVNGLKAHSTQKPEALLFRVILAASKPGDVVLDPFFGVGTTGAVAKRLGRRWIGIERDPDYIRIAQERIDTVQPELLREFVEAPRRQSPRIPFKRLIERGLLQPGQRLYFRGDRRVSALITAEGTLRFGDREGSIHALGRRLMNGSPCNGWQHWHYADDTGHLTPIDALRQRLLQE